MTNDRSFGWGMISGAAGSMIAWAVVSARRSLEGV